MHKLYELIVDLKKNGYGVVRTKDKQPLIKHWPHIASDQTIYPGNLQTAKEAGFVIPKGMVIIDVDPRNFKEGINSLDSLSDTIGFNLIKNAALATITASGGYHLYYKKPKDILLPNEVDEFKGVEYKQKGQQVILPYSVLPDGRSYSLKNETYSLDFKELPQKFFDVIGVRNKAKAITSGAGFINDPLDVDRVRQLLANIAPAVEGEQGDLQTFKVCCYGKDYGLTPDVFFDVLCEWNDRCSPPWGLEELRQKMINAYNYSQNAAGSHSIENTATIYQSPLN